MSPADGALAAGWPLALGMVAALARHRARTARRRRALERALHELRRPLQALALSRTPGRSNGNGGLGKLDLVLAALSDLEREVEGGGRPVRLRPVPCWPSVMAAVARWRSAAALAGSPIELRWRAGSAIVLADPARLAQALDNLLVNALQHGGPPIRVEASVCAAGVRIAIANGGGPAGRKPGGRRGHGLEVVAAVAAEHGGRFAIHRRPEGALAVLELPLAQVPPPAVIAARAA